MKKDIQIEDYQLQMCKKFRKRHSDVCIKTVDFISLNIMNCCVIESRKRVGVAAFNKRSLGRLEGQIRGYVPHHISVPWGQPFGRHMLLAVSCYSNHFKLLNCRCMTHLGVQRFIYFDLY